MNSDEKPGIYGVKPEGRQLKKKEGANPVKILKDILSHAFLPKLQCQTLPCAK
ncbi:hypothetical protein JW926_09255 [Candidatus Sumerlaeota bacterium]|nr:hypothetical protein [Candidatus Sumerlaeota bacterium]